MNNSLLLLVFSLTTSFVFHSNFLNSVNCFTTEINAVEPSTTPSTSESLSHKIGCSRLLFNITSPNDEVPVEYPISPEGTIPPVFYTPILGYPFHLDCILLPDPENVKYLNGKNYSIHWRRYREPTGGQETALINSSISGDNAHPVTIYPNGTLLLEAVWAPPHNWDQYWFECFAVLETDSPASTLNLTSGLGDDYVVLGNSFPAFIRPLIGQNITDFVVPPLAESNSRLIITCWGLRPIEAWSKGLIKLDADYSNGGEYPSGNNDLAAVKERSKAVILFNGQPIEPTHWTMRNSTHFGEPLIDGFFLNKIGHVLILTAARLKPSYSGNYTCNLDQYRPSVTKELVVVGG